MQLASMKMSPAEKMALGPDTQKKDPETTLYGG